MSRHVGGATRSAPRLLSALPRLQDHLDRSVLSGRPQAWADRDPRASRYPMDGNDEDGDCVAAGIAHYIESQWRREGPPYSDNVIAGPDVVAWYWAEAARQGLGTGQTPPGPGLDPLQAHVHWADAAIGFPQPYFNELAWVATIDLVDADVLAWAAWQARGVGISLELADDWDQSFTAPGPWSVTGPSNPANGHWVMLDGYNETGEWQLSTWGVQRWATGDFLRAYGQFGIVAVPQHWESLPGVNAPALIEEFRSAAGASPVAQT